MKQMKVFIDESWTTVESEFNEWALSKQKVKLEKILINEEGLVVVVATGEEIFLHEV